MSDRVRRRMQRSLTFVPPQRSNLQFWGDPSVGTYSDTGLTTAQTADGGSVQGWSNLGVGGTNATQATTAAAPTLKLAGINGKASLLFTTGSNQYLSADALGTNFSGTNPPMTIVFVTKMTSVATARYWFSLSTTGGTQPQHGLRSATGPTQYRLTRQGDAGGATSILGGTPDTAAHIVSWTSSGTAMAIYVDGASVSAGSINVGAMTFSNFTIGALLNPTLLAGSPLDGNLGDILAWNSLLGPAELSYVHSSLSMKYSIAVI